MGSSIGLSDGCVEIKLEVSSVESERGASGARVDMVAGLLVLSADAVTEAAAAAPASHLRPRVVCSWAKLNGWGWKISRIVVASL